MKNAVNWSVLMIAGLCALSAQAYEVAVYYFPSYHPNPVYSARYGKDWTEWNLAKTATPRSRWPTTGGASRRGFPSKTRRAWGCSSWASSRGRSGGP